MKQIANHIPKLGKDLASYRGEELIDRIGEDTIRELVENILCGENVRSLTENLTRKILALSNAALLATYLNASKAINGFSDNMSKLVGRELKTAHLTKDEKAFLQWLVGLTGKSVQNVLRSSEDDFLTYLNELEIALKESAEESKKIFGELSGEICLKDAKREINWPAITQIFMAIGAQTLAIRGAEKSMYGKLFEKLILGSLLTVLGFSHIDHKTSRSKKKVFWLSDRGEKRESDATLLYKPGVGVRFDIGFIGPGNTEISLDKVSRFETEIHFGRQTHYMTTIIIVDRIGKRSRINDMAKQINGSVVQMSMLFWVKEVAQILNNSIGFKHPVLGMSDKESIAHIKKQMSKVDLKKFIQPMQTA